MTKEEIRKEKLQISINQNRQAALNEVNSVLRDLTRLKETLESGHPAYEAKICQNGGSQIDRLMTLIWYKEHVNSLDD